MTETTNLPRRVSLINVLAFAIVSLAVLSFIGLYFLWIFERIQSFENQVESLRSEHIEEQELHLQRELTIAIDYIQFNKNQIERRAKKSLEERVNEAWSVADHLYQKNKDNLSDEEITSWIKESLRPVRFNNERGYYFATGYDGTELLFADRPEMEGLNILHHQTTDGVLIIQEMIKLIEKEGSGFYDYLWSKPDEVGKNFRKLSYIKGYEPLSFFLGAGEYLDDMEEDVKAEVLERIGQINFDKDGYIFVLDRESGQVYSHPNPNLIGTFMKDWQDKSIFQGIKRVVEGDGEGTYKYLWPKTESGQLGEKLSYIMQFEEWNWVLGAGYHLDDFENQISQKRQELQDELVSAFINGAIVIFCMIFLMILLCRIVANKIKKNITLFNNFFQRSATKASKIAEDEVVFKEFDLIARSANEMIDERLRIVKESDELHKQLQQSQKLEAIGTLAGGIAHDFNNLLTSIVGNISLLEIKLGKDDSRYKHIEALDEAAHRARDLVAQILTFGRRSPSKKEIISLAEIVEKSLSLLSVTLPSTIKIEKIITDEPCVVQVDATQMQQVIMNLCTNASQALPEKNGRIQVIVETKTVEDLPPSVKEKLNSQHAAIMKVEDNGVGIKSEVIAHIFDPFFSTKKVGEGTGLGLSVIHTIIERHGGVIEVESVLGEGTVFSVYLPFSQMDYIATEKEKIVFQRGKGRILLVDDEELILHTNSQVLEEFGYSVITQSNGKEALAYLRNKGSEIDLIITDQTMPEISGLEFIEQLREICPDIPIVLCTGYSARVDEKRALAAGCSAFLMKPMDLSLLSSTVARLINRK